MKRHDLLTAVDEVRNTSSRLTIDVADILLQGGVGDTAGSVGNRAVAIGAALLWQGCGQGRHGEHNSGGELHFEGCEYFDW